MKPENREILDYEAIGNRIRAERKKKKLTVGKLAELSNVEIHAISNYEYGKKRIGLTAAVLISKTLDMSLDYMLFGIDSNGLDQGEIEIVDNYRSLDDKDKDKLVAISKVMTE